jgi:hypothetical protein
MLVRSKIRRAARELLDPSNTGGPKLAAFWQLDSGTEHTNNNGI